MGNWNYGSSLDDWFNVMTVYNKEDVIKIIKKHYDEIKGNVLHNSYFGRMDSVLLYCYIREYKPKHILEVGAGITTKIMFKALEKNAKDVILNSYSVERMADIPKAPSCVKYNFYEGNFLETYYQHPPEFKKIDFVFIDGDHESYFSSFYCSEVLEKLNPGTLVHIHDVQDPDIFDEGYKNHYFEISEVIKYPSICDEHYTLFFYLKNSSYYTVLCNSSNLLERNENMLDFVLESKKSLWRNVSAEKKKNKSLMKRLRKESHNRDAIASSFYIIKN